MPEVSKEIARITAETAKLLAPFVRPIYAEQANRYELMGSCVLHTIGSDIYLLTAAHVADDSRALYVGGESGLVPFPDDVWRTPLPLSGKREDDNRDFAFAKLNVPTLKGLGAVAFLPDRYVDPADTGLGSLYLVLGYPYSINKTHNLADRKLTRDPLVFTNTACDESDYVKRGVSRGTNILVKFDRRSRARSLSGAVQQAPAFRGVSGGAIFRLTEKGSTQVVPRLVAIFTDRAKRQVSALQGVRISLILEEIEKQ